MAAIVLVAEIGGGGRTVRPQRWRLPKENAEELAAQVENEPQRARSGLAKRLQGGSFVEATQASRAHASQLFLAALPYLY
jgi:hypothetical protein